MNVAYVQWTPTDADVARFWAKVDKTDDCWVWMAATDSRGYGQFRVGAGTLRAHRAAYQLTHGQVPALPLDHVCRNKRCVRPEHLDPVAQVENMRRGHGRVSNALTAWALGKCQRGHILAVTGVYRTKTFDTCAQCARDRAREYRRKRKAA